MDIRYCGPRDHIMVVPYGVHNKDEIKEYPDEFGQDLLDTSTRQRFELVEEEDPAGKDKKGKKQQDAAGDKT